MTLNFRLLDLDYGTHQFTLFEFRRDYSSWSVALCRVNVERWDYGGSNHWIELVWNLFEITVYNPHPIVTVRADIWFWGKHYRHDRMQESPTDELPF